MFRYWKTESCDVGMVLCCMSECGGGGVEMFWCSICDVGMVLCCMSECGGGC